MGGESRCEQLSRFEKCIHQSVLSRALLDPMAVFKGLFATKTFLPLSDLSILRSIPDFSAFSLLPIVLVAVRTNFSRIPISFSVHS